jgi:hypothetical protein
VTVVLAPFLLPSDRVFSYQVTVDKVRAFGSAAASTGPYQVTVVYAPKVLANPVICCRKDSTRRG